MNTKIFTTYELSEAAAMIRRGGLVAMPTETVYGLAANALNAEAVAKIYAAKGRASDNPLIVHIAKMSDWKKLVTDIPPKAVKLAKAFWPGPLTIILKKSAAVPEIVSGGLDTVAVRMPSNKTAYRFIRECGCPLAAPSANLSGLPSPTKFSHVYKDLDGRVDGIIDGGDCTVGVESTVISLVGDVPMVLRPGRITLEQLRKVIGRVDVHHAVTDNLRPGEKAISPGMKYKHYSPKADVVVIDSGENEYIQYVKSHAEKNTAVICFNEQAKALDGFKTYPFGESTDSITQAKELFDILRAIDNDGLDKAFAPLPSSEGVGLAVVNRLLRAAGFNIIKLPKNAHKSDNLSEKEKNGSANKTVGESMLNNKQTDGVKTEIGENTATLNGSGENTAQAQNIERSGENTAKAQNIERSGENTAKAQNINIDFYDASNPEKDDKSVIDALNSIKFNAEFDDEYAQAGGVEGRAGNSEQTHKTENPQKLDKEPETMPIVFVADADRSGQINADDKTETLKEGSVVKEIYNAKLPKETQQKNERISAPNHVNAEPVGNSQIEKAESFTESGVAELKNDVAELTADETPTESGVGELTNGVAEWKNDVTELKIDETSTESGVGELTNGVAEWKNDVTELKIDETSTESGVGESANDVTELKIDETSTESAVGELTSGVDELNNDEELLEEAEDSENAEEIISLNSNILQAEEKPDYLEKIDGMKIIGITGKTGAGKSLITRSLAKKTPECAIINADKLYHTLLHGENLAVGLVFEFGGEVLTDRQVDRKKLAKIAFSSQSNIDKLNGATHPYVARRIRELILKAKDNGTKTVILDAPTLIESGLYEICDKIIFVQADKSLRMERIINRDGISEKEAKKRMSFEKDDSYYMEHATQIITNNHKQ